MKVVCPETWPRSVPSQTVRGQTMPMTVSIATNAIAPPQGGADPDQREPADDEDHESEVNEQNRICQE